MKEEQIKLLKEIIDELETNIKVLKLELGFKESTAVALKETIKRLENGDIKELSLDDNLKAFIEESIKEHIAEKYGGIQ